MSLCLSFIFTKNSFYIYHNSKHMIHTNHCLFSPKDEVSLCGQCVLLFYLCFYLVFLSFYVTYLYLFISKSTVYL